MTGLRRQFIILLAFVIVMTGPRLIAPSCAGSACPCPVVACGVQRIPAAETERGIAGACDSACCSEMPADPGGGDDQSDERDPQRSDSSSDCRCLLCLVCALKAPVMAERAGLYAAPVPALRAPAALDNDPRRLAMGIFHPPRTL